MIRIGGQRVPARTLVLLASDAGLTAIALLIAVSLRFHSSAYVWNYLNTSQTLPRFLFVIAACLLSLYYNDLYDSEVIRRRSELYVRLFQALGTACLALAIVYYFFPDWSLGRGIAALAAVAILGFTFGWRLLWERTGLMLTDRERVLILGTGAEGISLVRDIIARPELHMQGIGFLDEKGENISRPLVNTAVVGA